MRRKPDAVLVVHEVILYAAVGGRSPGVDQMLHVTLLERDIARRIRVIGVVVRD